MDVEINGTRRVVEAAPERSLLSVLREDLGLTGAKYGCGEGQCGACTVLLDGRPVMACITPIAAAAWKSVETVEGLADHDGGGDTLHPLQEAFIDCTAMQCGYCTPGMLMAALALLRQRPDPSEEEIVGAMQGNLCRCGIYPRIVQAIRQAATEMQR
jgi:aerobic-type carbon monoxide dehydrogenase small subunit (CoxS/CutS family)